MAEKPKVLPRTIKIRTGKSSRFSLSTHVDFHLRQYKRIEAVDLAKLHLTADMMKKWYDNILLEEDLNKQSQLSLHTAGMKEENRNRNELLTTFFGVVRAYMHSNIPLMRQSAMKIDSVIHTYYGIQEKPHGGKTADIIGLLMDLDGLTDEIAALGMTPVMTDLKAVNDKFWNAREKRSDENKESKLPTSHDVRPQTDEMFEEICEFIRAAYIYAATKEDRLMIYNLVEMINWTSDETSASHNMAVAQRKSTKEKKEELKQVMKMIPDFEIAEGWAPKTLKLTGKTAKDEKHNKLYQLMASNDPARTLWVKIENGKLVKVEEPALEMLEDEE